ncbi:hypothetical protein QTN47_21680 [Danxiaibacter flavus]|uniref:Uncharacterized protein n=1 Tax=Danxiaibacter flavus TaxID=3049108 RepID=A0ABV3ZKY7_9BACT|nr:hypothetical protein QNM32_21685 [Chitinophagaceae bacterium DXS]
MTQVDIERQIEVIRQTTKEILKSKATARQFLIDAGIIQDSDVKNTSKKKKK